MTDKDLRSHYRRVMRSFLGLRAMSDLAGAIPEHTKIVGSV